MKFGANDFLFLERAAFATRSRKRMPSPRRSLAADSCPRPIPLSPICCSIWRISLILTTKTTMHFPENPIVR